MDPVVLVLLGWLVFAGSHIGMAVSAVRRPLVARLGEPTFMVVYSLLASVGFAFLVWSYAGVRAEGPAGPALAAIPWARWLLVAVGLLGAALMVGGFAPRGYWQSPMMVLVGQVREPYGLERISRHPFFAGLVLLMGAHVLMSTRLVGSVFFGGFVVLSVLGSAHQATKLRERHGPGYQDFLAVTSAVPFAAIAAGRQRLVARELPWLWLALGVGSGVGLHTLHPSVMAHGGLGVTAVVVLGSWFIGIRALRRHR